MSTINRRIAGAPATWGICEVPDWGFQLAAERVLSDMQHIGLTHTELGPDDFLPRDPDRLKKFLAEYQMQALGAFCPIPLHSDQAAVRQQGTAILRTFDAVDASVMVISADAGSANYDGYRPLADDEWKQLLSNVSAVAQMATEAGVTACVHPHMGTMIQTRADVERFLQGCDVPLCLDTGHLLIGGTDPVQLALDVPERIAHVHFKDVDPAVLATVRSGQRSYTEGVRDGMYRVLGQGAIDLPAIVNSLETSGYRGWFVPEQDRILATEADGAGTSADAIASVRFLAGI
ncbi:MAG: TIM barrel protein [Nakamurella sp.]